MAEFEIGGMTFKGGKMFVALTALSTLGGSAWAGFEFYKDYTDMAEVVANIDVNKIEERNKLIESKLDAAIEYTRDIKGGLREDILSIEKQADRVEDDVRESEDRIRTTIQNAEERFENKRDALQNDYDTKANRLRDSNDTRISELQTKITRDMTDLEKRISEKLQRALDNPLAD
jgi:DNA anti-recombination protein RmuC